MSMARLQLRRTAKQGAKGWAGYKVAKQGAKGAKKGAKGVAGYKLAKRAMPSRRRSRSKLPFIAAAGAAVAAVLGAMKRKEVAATAKGAAHGAKSTVTPDRQYDDVTLARKVESEIFRPADAPKDKVSVNVADGVVELRGELDDQSQVEELGKAAGKVEGVKDVRNLLSVG
jgi:osmotically-inducible protein OsmY